MSAPTITMDTLLEFLRSDEELYECATEYLDDQVHDMKADEAAVINNDGHLSQLEYLIGVNPCEADLQWMLRKFQETQDTNRRKQQCR